MKYIALTTAALCLLSGCATPRTSATARDVSETPFPLISTAIRMRGQFLVKILSINGQDYGGARVINVDPGEYAVSYQCYGMGGQVRNTGTAKINAQPGFMYYIDGVEVTGTNIRKTTEVVRVVTTMTRDSHGRLIERLEPVYMEFDRSTTTLLGCTARIIECKGYLYEQDGSRFACMSEPVGGAARFTTKKNWSHLF